MDIAVQPLPASERSEGCFHCGEPLGSAPVQLALRDRSQDFCCAGCAAAASWIEAAGLSAYYRMREGDNGPRAQAEDGAGLFDRPALIERLSRPLGGAEAQRELGVRVDGLRCAACSWLVQRVADDVDGVDIEQLDGLSGRAVLRYDPQAGSLAELARRLTRLGYSMSPRAGAADQSQQLRARRQRWLRLAVAGLGAMQAMMFAWPLYGFEGGDMPLAVRDFFRWVGLAVTAPVVAYAAWPFFAGALQELRLRRPGMDLPIALAIALAFGGSVVATLLGSQAVYFESVAMFVFFLLLGRTIESGLRERVAARMAGLAEQLPAAVRRLVGAGTETIGLLELNVGDRIQLLPGETVPVDGELLDTEAQVSEAFLSGESRPVPRRRGDTVLAGSCVVGQPLQLQVSAIGEATALGELERLVSRASQGRAAWTRLADRAAQAFALIVLVAALATLLLWAGSGAEQALSATVAVLAAACPCALALALPTALAAATRALAQQQVLMVRAGGLERLASVDCVVFDKTGTLTEPSLQPVVQLLDPQLTQQDALALAAALERCSLHPLARAFAAADDGRAVEQAFEQTGAGVQGRIAGQNYRLGRASYCGLPSEADADLWLVRGPQPLARFSLDQQLRADARLTVARLRELGLPVLLYSGDHPDAVATVAAQLQVDDHAGGLRPDDKLARLQQLQQQGRRVLMVGDGMNDAPVLAAAHASLALAQGADMARQQADGVIGGGRLQQVAEALLLARAARRTIIQNLLWAGGYNLLAVPAAALGLLSPWAAALGMSLSSLLVLANAMRLLRQRQTARMAMAVRADESQAAA